MLLRTGVDVDAVTPEGGVPTPVAIILVDDRGSRERMLAVLPKNERAQF